MSSKKYLESNVYDATKKRIEYIFNEFDHVHVAFSGGKDSGLLLNLVFDYAKNHNCVDRLSANFNDCEVQYQGTIDYVKNTFNQLPIEKYWVCLPFTVLSAASVFEGTWIPWDQEKKDLWVRPMPTMDYVINENNAPFKFEKGMQDHKFENFIDNWVAGNHKGKTAVLVGIRADESLDRYRAIKSENKVNSYKGKNYITKKDNYYSAYPIYDWQIRDVWIANFKFKYSYNNLYNQFFKVGVPIEKMRVASPFTSQALSSLSLYKQIEPDTWDKMLYRVNGVNFASIYSKTKLVGNHAISLPKGMNWEQYAMFLVSTLPKDAKEYYKPAINNKIKGDNLEQYYKSLALTILKNERSNKYIRKGALKDKATKREKLIKKYEELF